MLFFMFRYWNVRDVKCACCFNTQTISKPFLDASWQQMRHCSPSRGRPTITYYLEDVALSKFKRLCSWTMVLLTETQRILSEVGNEYCLDEFQASVNTLYLCTEEKRSYKFITMQIGYQHIAWNISYKIPNICTIVIYCKYFTHT
jgi:hypothetical protein